MKLDYDKMNLEKLKNELRLASFRRHEYHKRFSSKETPPDRLQHLLTLARLEKEKITGLNREIQAQVARMKTSRACQNTESVA